MTRFIPPEILAMQARAADPASSAWVSANAGSGKTHVLARRVIRLLLAGTKPSKILCLTYTRAAAANMSNRVFRDLGEWSVAPDDLLAEKVREVTGHNPDAETLKRARRLFANALETPGGLKIQTIHAFCEAVLHQFPIEANIAGHFEMLDPQMEAALLAEARRDLIAGAGGRKNRRLEAAFAHVLALAGEYGFEMLLREIIARRDRLRQFIGEVGGSDDLYAPLFEAFGFDAGETSASVAAQAWPVPGFSPEQFTEFRRAAEETGASAVLNSILPDAIDGFAEEDPVLRLRLVRSGFLTDKGEPYAQNRFKKELRSRLPDLMQRYEAAAAHLAAAFDRWALMAMLEATRSALVIADRLVARYEQLKSARGFLDFNDLITRTVNLLSRPDAGLWVQYKLDQGIDHVLIDEGQDTSPEQWEVVRRLTEEFFAGEGARGIERTVFAVGDEKQSIYSFQGADPEAFSLVGRHFGGVIPAAGASFERVELNWSFRSTQDVLTAVDHVFDPDWMREGVVSQDRFPPHRAVRAGDAGHVEVWPAFTPTEVEEPDDWRQPIDHASAPAVKLAEAIAHTIREWMAKGETIRGRPVRPGDILVLVRKRDRFVNALSRALKDRQISVAGADRLRLTDHIAVKDMIALGRFVQQPEDDLSLAALLRSPAFGLSEEALFAIAHNRDHRSLFAALRDRAADNAALEGIVVWLERLRDRAAFLRPYEFFAHFLSGDAPAAGARSRFVARLGPQAGEILDEFLSYCLAAERSGIAGMEALLALLDGAAPEIRREMDQGRDEVRIMTVHAAKGLEAPIVFLIDPGSEPFVKQHLPRLIPFAAPDREWTGAGFLWRGTAELQNAALRAIEQEAVRKGEQEYRRLLYVGMTRAEDRLIVCGYQGLRQPGSPTWLAMVAGALDGADGSSRADFGDAGQSAIRFQVMAGRAAQKQPGQEGPKGPPAALPEAPPPALLKPVPPGPSLPRPLAPSGVTAVIEPEAALGRPDLSPVLDAQPAGAFALQRGTAIHRLLQMLPQIDPVDRPAVARRYIGRVGADWPSGEAELACAAVLAVLDDPRFGAVFAAGSRAEVELMGTVHVGGVERAVAGKIDRLCVGRGAVAIIDYKTNRPAPETLAEVPASYVLQLGLYGALLGQIYPDHAISAGLLFTDAPRLIEVPAEKMQAALARLSVS